MKTRLGEAVRQNFCTIILWTLSEYLVKRINKVLQNLSITRVEAEWLTCRNSQVSGRNLQGDATPCKFFCRKLASSYMSTIQLTSSYKLTIRLTSY